MANVPVSRTEINQNVTGCHPQQIEDLVAFRLDVAEVSMGAIIHLDFLRVAIVSSHLLKLIVSPGFQIFHHWRILLQDRGRAREHQGRTTNCEPHLSQLLFSNRGE
jgi:hypothetical protein